MLCSALPCPALPATAGTAGPGGPGKPRLGGGMLGGGFVPADRAEEAPAPPWGMLAGVAPALNDRGELARLVPQPRLLSTVRGVPASPVLRRRWPRCCRVAERREPFEEPAPPLRRCRPGGGVRGRGVQREGLSSLLSH